MPLGVLGDRDDLLDRLGEMGDGDPVDILVPRIPVVDPHRPGGERVPNVGDVIDPLVVEIVVDMPERLDVLAGIVLVRREVELVVDAKVDGAARGPDRPLSAPVDFHVVVVPVGAGGDELVVTLGDGDEDAHVICRRVAPGLARNGLAGRRLSRDTQDTVLVSPFPL
jgi:hypothetical protein